MAVRAFRKASPSPPRTPRRGRAEVVEPESLSPGSKLPPGPSELSSLALQAYKAGRELTYEQRGLVLQRLQRNLLSFLRLGPHWWVWDTDWVPHDKVLSWARGEGWRVAELDAVLAHLVLCGDVLRRDGESHGGLRSPEWKAARLVR